MAWSSLFLPVNQMYTGLEGSQSFGDLHMVTNDLLPDVLLLCQDLRLITPDLLENLMKMMILPLLAILVITVGIVPAYAQSTIDTLNQIEETEEQIAKYQRQIGGHEIRIGKILIQIEENTNPDRVDKLNDRLAKNTNDIEFKQSEIIRLQSVLDDLYADLEPKTAVETVVEAEPETVPEPRSEAQEEESEQEVIPAPQPQTESDSTPEPTVELVVEPEPVNEVPETRIQTQAEPKLTIEGSGNIDTHSQGVVNGFVSNPIHSLVSYVVKDPNGNLVIATDLKLTPQNSFSITVDFTDFDVVGHYEVLVQHEELTSSWYFTKEATNSEPFVKESPEIIITRGGFEQDVYIHGDDSGEIWGQAKNTGVYAIPVLYEIFAPSGNKVTSNTLSTGTSWQGTFVLYGVGFSDDWLPETGYYTVVFSIVVDDIKYTKTMGFNYIFGNTEPALEERIERTAYRMTQLHDEYITLQNNYITMMQELRDQAEPDPIAPYVTTDKLSYSVGESIIISGIGYNGVLERNVAGTPLPGQPSHKWIGLISEDREIRLYSHGFVGGGYYGLCGEEFSAKALAFTCDFTLDERFVNWNNILAGEYQIVIREGWSIYPAQDNLYDEHHLLHTDADDRGYYYEYNITTPIFTIG